MKSEDLKPNKILRGPLFPEPVQVLIASPMGTAVKLIGKPKPSALEGEVKEGPGRKKPDQFTFASLAWTGEFPPQKWMSSYTKVLSKFATTKGLKLKLSVEVAPEGGISKQKQEETKSALRELGLSDDLHPVNP